jgi:hypothetical protein
VVAVQAANRKEQIRLGAVEETRKAPATFPTQRRVTALRGIPRRPNPARQARGAEAAREEVPSKRRPMNAAQPREARPPSGTAGTASRAQVVAALLPFAPPLFRMRVEWWKKRRPPVLCVLEILPACKRRPSAKQNTVMGKRRCTENPPASTGALQRTRAVVPNNEIKHVSRSSQQRQKVGQVEEEKGTVRA